MKSSLKKLSGLSSHHKNDSKEEKRTSSAHLDELAQASQDMEDIRSCYDGLLSAAAATANCAYEFSEALKDLGTCLLVKTALNDDEESGKVLLMLGKAQFELERLVDLYRSHIIQTIMTPSESLLNELRIVEEMKQQCDEKGELLKYMLAAQKEKSKSRNSKGESFSPQQVEAAQEEYDEETTLFVFRLKSLKQGRSRSLLTQAARHHAAQLSFFQKGNKFLDALDPHVKLVTEQQHIDYQFSGLEDDGTDDGDDYSYEVDDAELSFDSEKNEKEPEEVSSSRNSMELDQPGLIPAPVSNSETAQEKPHKVPAGSISVSTGPSRSPWPGSQSAPIFPDQKFDPADKLKGIQGSFAKKFHTYVLPTPVDCKRRSSASSETAPITRLESMTGHLTQSWHSSPLGSGKNTKQSRHDRFSGPIHSSRPQSVLKDSNINSEHLKIPPPLAGVPWPQFNPHVGPDSKKIKRQAFSGPLTSKAWSSNSMFSTTAASSTLPIYVPMHQSSTSRKLFPGTSPIITPSPKISELHELPRPPLSSGKSTRPSSLVGYSAPLVPRGPELSSTNRTTAVSSHTASPLPTPPVSVPRSFSIPSSGLRNAKLEFHSEEVVSPPLTPISLTNIRPMSKASE